LGNRIEPGRVDPTESLSAVLLPIARLLLRNGFGAGELTRAAKQASINAALLEVIPLGTRVNISRLSVATGLTRKEIASFLAKQPNPNSASRKSTLDQRAWRVLRGWHSDPHFRGKAGRLAALPFTGGEKSFTSLVRQYGGDVTPRSVLRELERIKVVSRTRSGTLRLLPGSLRSRSLLLEQLSEITRTFKDFAATVSESGRGENQQSFFGFKESTVSSPDQAALFQRTFAERGANLLDSFEQWRKGQKRVSGKSRRIGSSGVRVGIGVYLIQD
jgi:hypothetical protein